MATSGHIREKDPHLTILDASGGSAVLPANASRMVALFEKARFIDSQNGRFLAQLLQRVGTQVITYPVRVPHRTSEQALHTIGASFSGMFSQLPTVFSRDVTQNPLQIRQCTATWLWTSEAWGKTGV